MKRGAIVDLASLSRAAAAGPTVVESFATFDEAKRTLDLMLMSRPYDRGTWAAVDENGEVYLGHAAPVAWHGMAVDPDDIERREEELWASLSL